MQEAECLSKMVAPSMKRPVWHDGIIQVQVTRACSLSCASCTQLSNMAGKPVIMTPEQFEASVISIKDAPFVVGVFGGQPPLSPFFPEYCRILREHIPQERCGLWTHDLNGHGSHCRITFNPSFSNLNLHMRQEAEKEFRETWPESIPYLKGLSDDSRHAPPFVSMVDLGIPEEERWDKISRCFINQLWSSLIGVLPGKGLRAFFCEIAYAMSVLHETDPDWPDTGIDPTLWYSFDGETLLGNDTQINASVRWWQLPMEAFRNQVRANCPHCSVPLNIYGSLVCDQNSKEQFSKTHAKYFRPKKKDRLVEEVSELVQLGLGKIEKATDYIQNSKK